MTTYAIDYNFRRWVMERIEMDASNMIAKLAPILTVDEVYREFNFDNETVNILKDTQRKVGVWNSAYNLMLLMKGEKLSTTFEIAAVMPKQMDMPVLGVNTFCAFQPIIELTQKWSILHYVVKEIFPLISRDAVSNVFPWIRSVIQEEEYSFTKEETWSDPNYKFYRKYMISKQVDKKKIDICMRAAMNPAKNIPILNYEVRKDAGLGDELWTKLRLLENIPNRAATNGMIKVTPRIASKLVPKDVVNAVEQTKEWYAAKMYRVKPERFDP